jgi:hypothetical protein
MSTTQAEKIPTRRGRRTASSKPESSQGPSGRSGPELVTTTKPAAAKPVEMTVPAPLTPAQKAAATRAAKAEAIKKQSEALARELAKAQKSKPAPAEKAPKAERVTGHRSYATKEITPAMIRFTEWIEREYADLFPKGVDARLVMIASKAYGHFQSSDLNPKQ